MAVKCGGCGQSIWSSKVGYCTQCKKQRTQHAASHTIEGHSRPVKMCPICERIYIPNDAYR